MILNLIKKSKKHISKIFSFQNNISAILILSFILMPFGAIKQARAQSVSGYSAGLLPAIATLPQCKNVKNSTKALFIGVGAMTQAALNGEDASTAIGIGTGAGLLGLGALELGDYLARGPAENTTPTYTPGLTSGNAFELTGQNLDQQFGLDYTAANAANQISGIETTNPTLEKKIDQLNKKTTSIEKSTTETKDTLTCTQSVGRLVIKMLLQKLTVSTVAWINSGFDGSPAFIQNPGKFFNDIAKNEILQLGLEINNKELFPFGKVWMRNTALAFNQKFADNARYSLNELIQNTSPSFSADTFYQSFAQGGWNAWTAMTQAPQNNPIGFKLLADNELEQRLRGTVQSTAEGVHEGLAQANGFLGDYRCVEPDGISREQHQKYLDSKGTDGEKCERWEYVTPGSLVAEAATGAMNYQSNAYLDAEDLNDAVAAILDALLSRFSTDIMEKGFANLGTEGRDGALIFDYEGLGNPYQTQSEKDFDPVHLSSSWLQFNPNFNIRTDLTQALIDEQRTYSDKLLLQNKELLSTTDGKNYKIGDGAVSNAYGLIPAIYQLDYCIPGPHPGWYEDSERALEAATKTIIPQTPDSLKDKNTTAIANMAGLVGPVAGMAVSGAIISSGAILGAQLGSFAPVVGTIAGAIVGAVIGGIVSWVSGNATQDNYESVRLYYATTLQALTGLEAVWKDPNDTGAYNLESNQGITQGMYELLRRYGDKIYKFYDLDVLPSVHTESAANYYQLEGYGKMIENNKERVNLLKATINTLGEIKAEVDKLNLAYPDGGEEYEEKLETQINAFGRLSRSMVNGDDIAETDNLTKQIISKKEYIYNNLIKGPYGCEADLEAGKPGALSGQVLNTKRMSYPFPIIYDYNKFQKGDLLPDPWGSGRQNREAFYNDDESMGPGFLSYVFFESDNNFGNWEGGYWESANPGSAGAEGIWTYRHDNGTWTAAEGKRGGIGKARFRSDPGSEKGVWGDCFVLEGATSALPNDWPQICPNYGTWTSSTGRAKDNGGIWANDKNWHPFNSVYKETFCIPGSNNPNTRISLLPRDWCMLEISGIFPLASTQGAIGSGSLSEQKKYNEKYGVTSSKLYIKEPVKSFGGNSLEAEYIETIRKPWTGGQFEAIIGIY